MGKATQQAKILAYCEQYGSITARDAFIKLDINSPRKVISDMRQEGYDVQTLTERKEKANGETVRYTRYFIKGVES